ncbi:MAG: hypothetical protein QM770_09500 [Tepidisphaeraceae bacterium]
MRSNPIYLLSAACMLLGCLLLTNDLSFHRVSVKQGLTLLATLASYQLALFAAGAFLALKRGVLRDATMLLVLDAIFLSDITFALSNLVTAEPATGLAIGLSLAGAGLARVAWVCDRLGYRMSLHRAVLLGAMLLLLPALPWFLKHADGTGGQLTPMLMYVVWWALGMLAIGTMTVDAIVAPTTSEPTTRLARRARQLQPMYLMMAWLSLVAHLGMLHWVYNVRYETPMASPMLLVGAVVAWRIHGLKWIRTFDAVRAEIALIAASVFVSSRDPMSLKLAVTIGGSTLTVSSWLITLVAAYIALTLILFPRHALWFGLAGAASAAWYLFGPTARQIGDFFTMLFRWSDRTARNLTPTTAFAWGVITVVVSFVLLAVGLIVSLSKSPDTEENPVPAA